MNRRDFLAFGLTSPLISRGFRRSTANPFDEIAGLLEQCMRDYRIPGAAFGVMKDGQLEMRAFGITNIEDPRQVTADTVFELASLSKTVTATAAMRLAFASAGANKGTNYDFIREGSQVRWLRIAGQIARKE